MAMLSSYFRLHHHHHHHLMHRDREAKIEDDGYNGLIEGVL
jgi:hypothetical protein